MFSNGDAGDVGGLEEVFRSDEFGRATERDGRRRLRSGWLGRRDLRQRVRPAPGLRPLARRRRRSGAPLSSVGGGPQGALFRRERGVGATAAGRALRRRCGVGRGARRDALDAPSKRHATRFGTIASVSALVALAAAGIMAGVGHRPRSNVSAQGQHDTARPHGVPHTFRCGVNGLDGSGRTAHGRSRVRWPVIGHGYERAARFGQRASGTRDPYWALDLHRLLRSRPWRPVTLRAETAGPRVPHRLPEAPIPPLLSRPLSGAR